jgi:gliding motility-associated-like protein
MKKVLFIISLITHYSLLTTVLHAQNLVPNASFENFSSCPTDQGQLAKAVPWFSPTYYSTLPMSDIFNVCAPPPPVGMSGVPLNATGFQYPRTGNGYAGEAVFDNYGDESRDYISVKLDSALEAGKSYCVNYYLSLSDYDTTIQQNGGSTYAIDCMGVYLSNTALHLNTYYAIPVTPQLVNPLGNFLADTVNWMLVSGTYTAQGGEQYITIGNFKDNAHTDFIRISYSHSLLAYYYIDDVSVYPCNAPVYAANAGVNIAICKGDSAQIGAAPHAQYLYSWQPVAGLSDTSIANPKASPAVTTTYYLHQKDFKFDETTDSITVTVNPIPAVTASASPANICSDSSSTLTAAGTATAYSWSNGSTGNQITVSPVTTTAYTVTGTGNYGCANTFSLTITVRSCEDTTKNTLTIPNAFTPNGDGVNDYFKINGQNIRSINGKIFNRWGQLLYNWNDVNKPWDGKYNNKNVSDGVYFYILEVTFNNGETREKHGSIEVVK